MLSTNNKLRSIRVYLPSLIQQIPRSLVRPQDNDRLRTQLHPEYRAVLLCPFLLLAPVVFGRHLEEISEDGNSAGTRRERKLPPFPLNERGGYQHGQEGYEKHRKLRSDRPESDVS